MVFQQEHVVDLPQRCSIVMLFLCLCVGEGQAEGCVCTGGTGGRADTAAA